MVRPQVVGIGCKHISGAAEAGHHLVDDEKNIVPSQYVLQSLEIGSGRQNNPGRRLDPAPRRMRPIVSGPSGHDERFDTVNHASGEGFLRLSRAAVAPIVGTIDMEETVKGQVEAGMGVRHTRHAGRCECCAVEAQPARDDFLLRRTAEGVVVEPDQLDVSLVGLGARVDEERLGQRGRRQLDQRLGEINDNVCSAMGKCGIVGQPVELARRSIRQPLLAEAEARAPHPRKRVEIGVALLVIDVPRRRPE